ncbi:conserved hypothetical protein [Gloeothece citriformis PCC 7424]|uniref:Uncharacterized protein n=1 Tax=Gloeothece citriformis (strain PCC 7424) TaxID=65393 RepID=B7KFP4_GLOC7|nr:hypothetical protein [Gloeothece citriformis]ACK73369.1 conserved hypothetical protein [Gloeothece citriformis PCC 7424]
MGFKSIKPFKFKQISITIICLLLLSFPIVLIQKAIWQTTVFYGVEFPSGVISFADSVVSYRPIILINEQGLSNVSNPFNNPNSALGIPNSSHPKNPFLPLDKRNDVSLGIGGSITLQFKDNLLTGSGNNKIDLWVFEAGETIESVFVEISKDGVDWYSVGQINENHPGIDIDQFGWHTEDFFSYVRLKDDPFEGDHQGIWNDQEWIGWGGADIDAVGAISSVSLTPTPSNSSVLSFPIFKWALMMFLTFAVGFAISYFLKKYKYFD